MEEIEPFVDGRDRSLRCPFCCKPGSTTSHYMKRIFNTSSQGIKKVSLTDWSKKNNFKGDSNNQQILNRSVEFYSATCNNCGSESIYVENKMMVEDVPTPTQAGISVNTARNVILLQKCIYPESPIPDILPVPSESMPEDVKKIYNEAASVFNKSLRASGTLIRITLETLLKNHTEADANSSLNIMIGQLSRTMPSFITEMMDNNRVFGNSNAHAHENELDRYRQINETENKEQVIELFTFVNLICDQMGLLAKSHEMYERIPDTKKNQISKRNKKFKKE